MGCCDLTLRHTTISVEEQKRRERRRRQRQRCFDLFKKFIAFLFSHIGLCALVVGYSIMGGFLFRALEAGNEMAENMKIIDFKEKKIREIYDVAKNTDSRKKYEKYSNFSREVRKILIEFQVNVISAVKDKGWDGKDRSPDDEMDLQWSFAGALLYAVTVITTIGYGHVAPKTTWGRLVTILYALIGIPLTFLYLSNIGTFLAEGFRLVYKKVCCDLCCCQKCERKRKRQRERIRRLRHLQAEAKSGQLMRALSVKKSPPTNIVVANECMQNTSAETTIEPLPFFPDKDNIINEAEEILGPAPAYDDHLPLQPNEKDNSNPDMGNNAHLREFKTNQNIKEDSADEQKGKEQSVENSKLKRKESSKKEKAMDFTIAEEEEAGTKQKCSQRYGNAV